MAYQDARLSKFEADFKQQQGDMTNKIDTFLKVINDRMTGALTSDTVKNLKPNVNSTSLVLSARSYPTDDPQSSSRPLNPINAIKTFLEDEFKDLHLNLTVLEVLAHAPMYNEILDKYVESQELGKNGSAFIQGIMPEKMKDPRLFTLPCSLGDSKPFDTLANLGSCVNLIPLYLFKKLKIRLLEEIYHVFRLANGTKSYLVGIVKNVEVHIGRLKLLDDLYVIDMDKDPATPLLVGRGFLATANAVIDCARPPYYAKKDFTDYHLPDEWEIVRDGNMWESEELIENRIDWNKPPKRGDGAWHTKIRLIDPDGEEFTKTLQSIPTTRMLSEKENLSEIIDFEHFHDS
ncbi:MAK10-like protein [Tanacetum coccineum]